MGKTPRQEKAYDRNCREPHHFWGVEMGEMEFVFGFWGTKTVSRVLWFYFPMAVGLRLTPFPSETLRYGLQAKLPSEHLEKTEIRAETFCLALALPALMVRGSLHSTQIFQVSLGFVCPPYRLQGHLLSCA